jgi:U3 small nucleolar RNA-associated protein 13
MPIEGPFCGHFKNDVDINQRMLKSFGVFRKRCMSVSDVQRQYLIPVLARYCRSAATIVAVHADQNIIFHSLQFLAMSRHLIGFNDEIVDAVFLSPSPSLDTSQPHDSYIALATNSALIRTFAASQSQGLDCHLLSGHGDTVLALDCSADRRILISGGKDNTVRVWSPVDGMPGQWACVAVGEGHAESVGALAISRKSGVAMPNFLVTGSQDSTIKLWDLTGTLSSVNDDAVLPRKLPSLVTQKAHDKDVNSLDISPNDRLLATGSQDKTAKIFEIQYQHSARATLKLVGTLKGHKRGIWNVKFSKTEKLIATASGDKSVKLWTLEDCACIKVSWTLLACMYRVDCIIDLRRTY